MDFSSIADVQVTINYTALYSDTLRSQVLKKLGTDFQAKRALSVQLFFPDAWYDLYNPQPTDSSVRTFSFTVTKDAFPVNIDNISVNAVTMYFQKDSPDINNEQVKVASLTLAPADGTDNVVGRTNINSIHDMISTHFLSGIGWLEFIGKSPFGKWTVQLTRSSGEGIEQILAGNTLKDIIFVIEYNAELPAYNVF